MKYLCLVYLKEQTLNGLSRSERVALSDGSMGYCEELQKNGQFITASPSIWSRQQRLCKSARESRTLDDAAGQDVVTAG